EGAGQAGDQGGVLDVRDRDPVPEAGGAARLAVEHRLDDLLLVRGVGVAAGDHHAGELADRLFLGPGLHVEDDRVLGEEPEQLHHLAPLLGPALCRTGAVREMSVMGWPGFWGLRPAPPPRGCRWGAARRRGWVERGAGRAIGARRRDP